MHCIMYWGGIHLNILAHELFKSLIFAAFNKTHFHLQLELQNYSPSLAEIISSGDCVILSMSLYKLYGFQSKTIAVDRAKYFCCLFLLWFSKFHSKNLWFFCTNFRPKLFIHSENFHWAWNNDVENQMFCGRLLYVSISLFIFFFFAACVRTLLASILLLIFDSHGFSLQNDYQHLNLCALLLFFVVVGMFVGVVSDMFLYKCTTLLPNIMMEMCDPDKYAWRKVQPIFTLINWRDDKATTIWYPLQM